MNKAEINTFTIHFRDELRHIQTLTHVKESYDLHETCVLMRTFKNKYIRQPFWKRIFVFSLFLSLLSCTCLPQIPTQQLYVDSSCQATVPDYMTIFDVYDNCTDVDVVQYPAAGTILDQPDPFSVDLVAKDKYGNSTGVTFNVEILDTIGPQLIYTDDTLIVIHQEGLDQVIQWYIDYRHHIGDTAIERKFTVWF
jgi:hypothetical protein